MLRFALRLPSALFLPLAVLFLAGCDTFGGEDGSSLRDRLVGSWTVETQTERYFVTPSSGQTVLDPDAELPAAFRLSGIWNDGPTDRPVDAALRYARHAALETRDGPRRGLLLSTHPIRIEDDIRIHDAGDAFAIRLSDVFSRETATFTPDGRMEGVITAGAPDLHPGQYAIDTDTVSADPLPEVPLSSSPRMALPEIPFQRTLVGTDTLALSGTSNLPTQSLPADQESDVDVQTVPPSVLDTQKITYRFAANDSLTLTARVNNGQGEVQLRGTWELEGDSLRMTTGNDATTALVALTDDRLTMTFDEIICSGALQCRAFYEAVFGLTAGTLQESRRRLVNELRATDTETTPETAAKRPTQAFPLSGRPALHEEPR